MDFRSPSGGDRNVEGKEAALPLAGLRVLDLSQVMAGPFCCMLLGDMGADVIKVEPPDGGDQTRKAMGFRMKGTDSPGFLALNRNKRSIALNLKSEAGGASSTGWWRRPTSSSRQPARRRGAARGRLRDAVADQPAAGLCLDLGFADRPWSQRPGFDLIAQAMTGVISAMGIPGAEPVKSGVPIGDLGAGLFATYAILSAVIGRAATAAASTSTPRCSTRPSRSIWETTELWATGRSPQPLGTANRMSAPYQAYRAADGAFVVGAANQRLWLRLCEVVERPDLLADPRFSENKDRLPHRAELNDELAPVFAEKPVAHWVEAFLAAGVPAGPINDYAQALESEHAAARGSVIEIDHPVEGRYRALGYPVKMSETQQAVRYPPPLLGEHTAAILRELGLDGEQPGLHRDGAFSA